MENIEIDRWGIEAWAAHSRLGEVCGIYGCRNTPVTTCPHCENNYCQDHCWVMTLPGHKSKQTNISVRED